MLRFWSRWLAAAGGAMAALGAAMAALYGGRAFDQARDGVNAAFWPGGATAPELARYQHWVHAVLGGTLLGWGVMFAWVAAVPFRRGEPGAWWSIAVATTAWYVVDTAASLHFGVIFNAALNTVLYAAFVVPIAGSARLFFTRAT